MRQNTTPSERSASATSARSLNVPFLIVSIVVAGVLGTSAYFLRQWQVARTAKAFVARADTFEAESKWTDAAEYLSRYLQLAPDDHPQRIRLARTYEKGITHPQQRPRAIGLYYRAIGAGVKEEELALRQSVGSLLLSTGRYIEAEKEAAEILKVDSQDAKGLRLRAIALVREYQSGALSRESLGKMAIVDALRKGFATNPDDVELAQLLAYALRDEELCRLELPDVFAKDRHAEADKCMDQMVAARPQDARAFLSRYAYRARLGLSEAQQDLEEAQRLAPDDVAVLSAAAQFARAESDRIRKAGGTPAEFARHLERARELYKRIVDEKLAPKDPGPRVALGETLLVLGRADEAIAVWQTGLTEFKNSPAVFHAPLASIWLDQGKLAEAGPSLDALDEEIRRVASSVSRESRLVLERDQALRRGIWHIKQGEPQKSIALLKNVVLIQEQLGGDTEQSTRAWLLLGGAYASLGEWGESGSAYDRASTQQPKLALARLAAAASWLAANRADVAADRAEHAIRLNPTARAWYTLAAASFQKQSALPEAERVWDRLEESMLAAEEQADDGTLDEPWRIDLLRADYLLAKGSGSDDPDQGRLQAVEALRRAGSKYPFRRDLWQSLPLIYQRLSQAADADAACEHLSQLPDGEGDSILVRTRVLSMRGEYDLAEQTLREATKGSSPVDPRAAQRELINLKLSRRDLPAARALLLEALKTSPRDLSLLRRVADIALDQRRLEEVAETESAMQRCGGLGETLASYFKVRRLMLQIKSGSDPLLNEAASEASKLYEQRPYSPEVISLKGLVDQRQGRFDAAIMAFEQAIELGEQRVAIYEQLISLLEKVNRSADAEKYLSRLKSHVPFSQDLTVFESSVEIRRNQPEQALEVAQRGVERRPNDPAAHLWLGRMLLVSGKREEAEKALEKAVELDPTSVRSWNGLFSFYLRLDQKQQARDTLDRLAKNAKLEEAERRFVLAQGYELLGDQESAAASYQAAAAAAPENTAILLRMSGFYLRTNPDESQKCLRKVLRIDPNSGVARRTLSAILAARGSDEDWDEVNRLLLGAEQEQFSSQDNRLSAVLLVQRGGAENYTRAARILEELVARPQVNVAADRLMLAQIYEKQSRIAINAEETKRCLDRARDQYISLCARTSPQPGHLIAFVEFLLRHNEKAEGAKWLDKFAAHLEVPNPSSIVVAEYVRLALALGNEVDAEKYQAILEQQEPDALATVSLRTRLMVKHGKSDEVEAFVEAAAARLLEKAKDDRQRAAVMQGIGSIYASADKLALAERWHRKLYEVVPEAIEPLIDVLVRQGRITESLDLCASASQESPRAAYCLAGILMSGKAGPSEVQRAETLLKVALDKYPKDSRLLFSVATIRVVQGRPEEGVQLFRKVVDLNPRHVLALNNLATLLSEVPDQRREALKYIDKAIEITGNEAALFDTKGTILVLDGQSEKAIEFLRAAVEGPEADPRYRFHLALAYKDLKDLEQARNELEKALEQNLEKQILTPTEQKLLTELRSILTP